MPHNFSDIPISTGPALVLSPPVAGWVIVRWIAGVAALVGILETIRFAILIPQVFAIIGPIIGTRWHALARVGTRIIGLQWRAYYRSRSMGRPRCV